MEAVVTIPAGADSRDSAFDGAFRGARVLVTGHTGFKGAWLTTWLLRLGAEVCGFSVDIPTDPSLFVDAGLASRIRHVVGDIRDEERFRAVLLDFQPSFVFHLAAQAIVSTSYQHPVDTVSANVVGTAVVLSALRALLDPCAVIVVTSDKCYENLEQPWGYREIDRLGGKDVYSASKAAAEIITSSFQTSFFSSETSPVRVASARAGNVIGGGDWAADRIVADCARAWMQRSTVKLRRPSSTRPWQHVLEPLSGYLALAAVLAREPHLNGQSYNFGPRPEQSRTVLQLITDLASRWELPPDYVLYQVLPAPPFHEAGLLKLNCDKALVDLGWEPTLTYDECVTTTAEWYQQYLFEDGEAFELTQRHIEGFHNLASERGRAWTA